MKQKDGIYRPSLDVQSLALLQDLLQKKSAEVLDEDAQFLVARTTLIITKELVKARFGVGAAYVRVPEEERKRSAALKVTDMFSMDEIAETAGKLAETAAKPLTDREKIAAMSPEEQDKLFEAEMAKITGSQQ